MFLQGYPYPTLAPPNVRYTHVIAVSIVLNKLFL